MKGAQAELVKLRRECQRLKLERDFCSIKDAERAERSLAGDRNEIPSPSEGWCPLILRPRSASSGVCRCLEVSPAGFYAWQGRPESAHNTEDRKLAHAISVAHQKSRQTYGTPRIQAILKGARGVYHTLCRS